MNHTPCSFYEDLGRKLDLDLESVGPDVTLARLKERFKQSESFRIFGAGQAGLSMRKRIEELGGHVLGFIDNNPDLHNSQIEGLPVVHPNDLDPDNLRQYPIIIASMYFIEIADQLSKLGLRSFHDYFVLQGFLFEENIMSHGYGTEMETYCANHWNDLLSVFDMWRDDASRYQFLRYLYLRLYFLTPEKWHQELFQYEDFESHQAARFLQHLEDPLKTMFANMIKENLYVFGGPCSIRIDPGDIVIDGGAWLGDSTLDFALKAGASGHVHAFEPTRAHAEKLQQLVEQLQWSERVSVMQSGLWDRKTTLNFVDSPDYHGAGSYFNEQGDHSIDVIDLDSYLGSDRIDFLKLDIEGSELMALKGAEKVLRRERPKLAICLYHKPQDLHEIPAFLKELDLGYHFYFRHRGTNPTDAILFASVEHRGL